MTVGAPARTRTAHLLSLVQERGAHYDEKAIRGQVNAFLEMLRDD